MAVNVLVDAVGQPTACVQADAAALSFCWGPDTGSINIFTAPVYSLDGSTVRLGIGVQLLHDHTTSATSTPIAGVVTGGNAEADQAADSADQCDNGECCFRQHSANAPYDTTQTDTPTGGGHNGNGGNIYDYPPDIVLSGGYTGPTVAEVFGGDSTSDAKGETGTPSHIPASQFTKDDAGNVYYSVTDPKGNVIAKYKLKSTKKYVPDGCGGKTEVSDDDENGAYWADSENLELIEGDDVLDGNDAVVAVREGKNLTIVLYDDAENKGDDWDKGRTGWKAWAKVEAALYPGKVVKGVTSWKAALQAVKDAYENGGYTGIDSIETWGHGSEGRAVINGSALDVDDPELASLIAWIKTHWAEDAKGIHFLHCSVAAGVAGRKFMKRAAEAFGANIRAHTVCIGMTAPGEVQVKPGEEPDYEDSTGGGLGVAPSDKGKG